ncbi:MULTISPECIES: GNAT family N-acetyltransferase [unclassified Exiguobacterium]|uniref:GNAT family N-acetyltransferase n=1 Tax=unclassified Exiguobacterium TaxID=2644629 RepID=UPI001BE8C649
MIFTTERLEIRPFTEKDLHATFEMYSKPEVCRYLLHEPWTTENVETEFRKKRDQRTLSEKSALSLAVLHQQKVIGDLTVWYTGMKETVEIGYCFSDSHSGKGYATEAVSGLLGELFTKLNLHRVQANLDARNVASQKLCERVGMRKEAHFIKDYWSKQEWTDSMVYAMLHEEFVNKMDEKCEWEKR